MANNQITAVLFDWDFTLAYSISPHMPFSARLAALFQKYGVQTSSEQMAQVLDEIRLEINTGVLQASLFPQEKRAIIRNYRIILEKLSHADTSYHFAYELYSGYAKLPHFLYDDVEPTLQKLTYRGYRIGILSNHSISVLAVMEKLLGRYVSPKQITVSEAIDIHKPHADIFFEAAARLNVRPAACLYVGDNLEVDAIGAVQQGGYAQGLWLNRQKRPSSIPFPPKVGEIHTLGELLNYLS